MTAYNGFPLTTTSGKGLFKSGGTAEGLIQGTAFPDPATRNWLRSGIVSGNETVPMFGGIAVNALIAPVSSSGARGVLGQSLQRATSLATLVGFTVFNQSYNAVSDPSNPVPTVGSNQSINYYPNGSRARIALAAAPNLIDYLGDPINQQVSWDFVNNMLVPYAAAYGPATITDAVWASTSGGEITFTLSAPLSGPAAGDWVEIAGTTATGGAAFNGMFEVVSNSAGTMVVSAPAAAGYYGTYAADGTVLAGGGALPVTILDIQGSGCMTVSDAGGLFTWDYDGAAAVVQLTGGTVA